MKLFDQIDSQTDNYYYELTLTLTMTVIDIEKCLLGSKIGLDQPISTLI